MIILQSVLNAENINRREMILTLGKALTREHMERRDLTHFPRDLQEIINKQLGKKVTRRIVNQEPPRKARCRICPRHKDRKTKTRCEKCEIHICMDHTKHVCESCL